MAYLRKAPNAEVLVLLNLSDEETGFILHDELIDGDFTDVFDNIIKKIITGSFIRLNAWGYKVFERSW